MVKNVKLKSVIKRKRNCEMARDFNMELINYTYSNGCTAMTKGSSRGHIPRTPPPSPPPNGMTEECRVPPLSLEDIPEFLLCKERDVEFNGI